MSGQVADLWAIAHAAQPQVQCPACGGAGVVPAVRWDGSEFAAYCQLCEGSQWVPIPVWERYVDGRAA